MQIIKQTYIDFVGRRRLFYIISIAITLAGLVAASIKGIEYGIDFEGGTEAAFEFSNPIEPQQIREALGTAGFLGAELKSFGRENQYLIRVESDLAPGDTSTTRVSDRLKAMLAKSFPDNQAKLLMVENIGPRIGAELRQKALIAVLISVVAILLYITIRYEFLLAVGAIIGLVHDVLVAFSFAVIFNGVLGLNLEMNQGMLAAFLTVIGFSVNDTVINFDRLRENRALHKSENMMMLINRSINETLPRTVLTGFCVALVLLILLFFAGEVLRGFAFVMLVGLITGTYSSVYIAGSFVVDALILQKKLDPNARRMWTDKPASRSDRRKAASLPKTPAASHRGEGRP